MNEMSKCNQAGCDMLPFYRFTWPGRDEAHVCMPHALALMHIASAIGLHLQLIPIDFMALAECDGEPEPAEQEPRP